MNRENDESSNQRVSETESVVSRKQKNSVFFGKFPIVTSKNSRRDDFRFILWLGPNGYICFCLLRRLSLLWSARTCFAGFLVVKLEHLSPCRECEPITCKGKMKTKLSVTRPSRGRYTAGTQQKLADSVQCECLLWFGKQSMSAMAVGTAISENGGSSLVTAWLYKLPRYGVP
jgi:hypothetical protein